MSTDEPEARMWDEDSGARYGSHGAYYDSAFGSEQLDRAPLLSEESYTEVPMTMMDSPEHCHWKTHGEPPSAVPQLIIALVLCAFFMVCELIGGYLAGSLSVMCDAAHLLSDCGGFALALLAFKMARRRPDTTMSYGYKRAEVLGAMVSVLLIWALTAVFVYVAGVRLYTGDYDIESDSMIIISGCGVAFNVVMAIVLHGCGCGKSIAHHHTHHGAACTHGHAQPAHGHGHSHGHGHCHCHGHHGHSPAKSGCLRFLRKEKPVDAHLANGDFHMKDFAEADAHVVDPGRNINLRAALVHVIGDLIQSCGVLLASIIIKFYPAAKVIDPVCTFMFSVLVMITTVPVVRDALAMLMQAVPKGFRYRECVAALSAVGGVRHVHSLHAWALSSHHAVVSAHVAIDELSDPEIVLNTCLQLMRKEFSVQFATIQVERYSEIMRSCLTCREQPAAVRA